MSSPVVEQALNIGRLAKTVIAARQYDKAREVLPGADDQTFWNMRQAMSLSPRVGKAVSKVAFRNASSLAWQIPRPRDTRFVQGSEVGQAVDGLRRDGYYVFNHVVDRDLIDLMRSHAERVPAVARGAATHPAPYPRTSPAVGRYDIEEEEVLESSEMQEFVTDPLMALIARDYLEQPVVMDEVACWWTTTKRAEDADLNAQMFHQDRDRLAFLKFFIYLTDVTPDTGPHVYIRGSHRKIPSSLRFDGRVTDETVQRAGLWHEVHELTGPAGTLMAVDTIGLHKGKTPTGGDRLALENEFSTSLFGTTYAQPTFTPTALVRERFADMPFVLQRYAQSLR